MEQTSVAAYVEGSKAKWGWTFQVVGENEGKATEEQTYFHLLTEVA